MYNIHSNSTENSVNLIFSDNIYKKVSTDLLLNDDNNNNQVKSFPFTPFRNKVPTRNNTSGLCSQLLPWPLYSSFPLFQLHPVPLSSSSFFGLPLLLCPCVFQFITCLSLVEESFLSARPIHFHFRSLISAATRFSCARLHSSSFEITPGQRILKVLLRHLFIDFCRSFVILGATFDAFYPYRRTNMTLLSKILNFVATDTFPAFHTR
jgi:hypothetical protein